MLKWEFAPRCALDIDLRQLNIQSIVAQNKALYAVATEQVQLIEMEQRLLQAETALGAYCLFTWRLY